MKLLHIYLLQFQVYAEEKLLYKATTATKEVRDTLKLRTQQYQIGTFCIKFLEKQNNWMKSSQNKQSKSSLLTSTLPAEDISFKKDESILSKTLFKATLLESYQKSILSTHSSTLSALISHLPTYSLPLQKCMKLYRKLASEMVILEDLRRLQKSAHLLTSKESGLKVLKSMVLGEFETIAQMGQGKDLLANLHYLNDDLGMAEVYWMEEVRR
jgi:hypothetical protein